MENVPNILAMRNGRYRHQIVNAFRAAGYERTAVVTLTAADFGVPQERHRVFFIGLCDSLPFEGTVDQACARLFAVRMSDSRITVRQAISDLPEGVAIDDGALPYPGRRPGRYTEYQKVMRLDFDTALLSKQVKAAQLADGMALHNHHTKGIEDRRRRIIEAIRPGRRGDFCLQNYGKAQERTSGAASIRSGRRTPSLLRCIAISLSGFTPNLIAGSPCGKRRACSLFTMAFVSVAVSTSSYAAGPAVDAARKLKPTIPVIGEHGIPVHEEIDLCRVLATNSAEDLTARPPWSQNPAQRPEIRHDCQKSP